MQTRRERVLRELPLGDTPLLNSPPVLLGEGEGSPNLPECNRLVLELPTFPDETTDVVRQAKQHFFYHGALDDFWNRVLTSDGCPKLGDMTVNMAPPLSGFQQFHWVCLPQAPTPGGPPTSEAPALRVYLHARFSLKTTRRTVSMDTLSTSRQDPA